MILPSKRDPRLITIRRGGTLTDEHHHLLAEWAAQCAEHVLPLFEHEAPDDTRPRDAIAVGRAWIRGEVRMTDAHNTAFVANAAAKGRPAPAKFAALAAGQAVAVAHVAAQLPGFLHTYNYHRCHTALGGQTPISRVNNPAGQYT